METERDLPEIYEFEGWGLATPNSKEALKALEQKKRKVLEEKEAARGSKAGLFG